MLMRFCTIATLFAGCSVALADTLTNKRLVSLMPADVESVMLLVPQELASEKSAFGNEFSALTRTMTAGEGAVRLDKVMNVAASGLGIRKVAIGGSNFAAPTGPGPGAGAFSPVTIYVLDKPADALKQDFEKNPDKYGISDRLEHGGKAVFKGRIEGEPGQTKPIEVFAAFLSDHAVAVSENQAQIESIIASFESGSDEVPAQWKDVAQGLAWDSPAIVLRKYNPENTNDVNSPLNARRPPNTRADIDSVALVIPSVDRVAFRLRCKSPNPDRAVSFYRSVEMRFYLLPELLWQWTTTTSDDGFTADIVFTTESGKNHHSSMILYMLFGVNLS